jgi:replicative DNA helicase
MGLCTLNDNAALRHLIDAPDAGIPAIDRIWGGLWPGELYYLMARSRTGKTPCMMQIARNVAGELAAEAIELKRPPDVAKFT